MGIFQIRAFANKTVTFTMAEGVKASKDKEVANMSENTAPIKIAKNNFEGYLVIFMNPFYADPEETLHGPDTRISGNKVTVNLVKNSIVMFRANSMPDAFMQTQHKYSPGYAHMHHVISREIITGKVGAEIVFRNGTNQASIANYAPVNLQVRDKDRNCIMLGIESESPEGRVITINVDNGTIDLSRPESLRLRYDGTVIEKAGSIDELFAGLNSPLYYLIEENGTATMAVYIPKFSENELVIDLMPGETESVSETGEIAEAKERGTEKENTTEPESTPAFEFGLAVAGLATAYRLKHRL